ncbi:UPF0481 protein At3g47200-like isoform X2 [Andrographis paniculata]|uniref:UPF0481 protein At3g47200-like isoform X2 n=1 Tax=Andrographis paniculata TaxID=175694 RepID=UPI0021E76165|nr:UPF0481 protein At3g47200-like isoform X2 [Andrographis paniculata]
MENANSKRWSSTNIARYLKLLLERKNESSVHKYVTVMRSLQEQARRCYADPVDLESDSFVEMLLLDSFFIVELTRKYRFPWIRETDDPIFKHDYYIVELICDLMLIENQVPFFVLNHLFHMTKSDDLEDDLIPQIQLLFGERYLWHPGGDVVRTPVKNVDHLLDLMYKTWCSSFSEMFVGPRNLTGLDIRCATELQEAGIEFEEGQSGKILDIKFDKGVLKIPSFIVSDGMEPVLRNLILYEHLFNDSAHPQYVTDYAFFLQCLINSPKDVEILRLRGIMTNLLGNDMVHQMFRRLGRNTFVSKVFCYGDVFEKVNIHCGLHRNVLMANLRRNYFNSPWAYISFGAAAVLLILTFIQTMFSGLSYASALTISTECSRNWISAATAGWPSGSSTICSDRSESTRRPRRISRDLSAHRPSTTSISCSSTTH